MVETDLPEFSVMLDAVCSMLSRGTYTPNDLATGMFFRAMARWPLADVRGAFDAHVADPQRGRFVPVPADLIAQIEARAGDDGRPGAEEAWALSLAARDEADTVVWTAEMAAAWTVARGVFDLGDEVGARMAFREAYTRLVEEARRGRVAMAWQVSLGFDAERRALAIASAVSLGRLPMSQLTALPAPPRGDVLLLADESEGTEADGESESAKIAREKLLEIAAKLRGGLQPSESKSHAAILRTRELQAEAGRRVAQAQAGMRGAA